MAKRKSTKGQTMIYKKLHIKLKIKYYTNPLKNEDELRFSGRVDSFYSTSGTHSVNSGDKSWMRKVPESVYNKWSISVVICDKDIL
jgi:hypothetical protein